MFIRRSIIFLLATLLTIFITMPVHGEDFSPPIPGISIEDEMVLIKTQLAQATEDELYSDEEIDLIALVCLGEAEGESELGKRLVIDTILNRLYSGRWPDTISGVCWQRGQYGCLHNGRCSRCKVNDYVRQLVREEIRSLTNSEVIYFSGGGYNGSPLFQEGGHYFSK